MVRLGVENLLEGRTDELAGDRVGLITSPSGVDRELRTTIDLLDRVDDVDLRRLFGPEHGIRGRAQAGETVEDSTDGPTGLPVSSLYGDTRRPDAEDLADLDALVYDMQGVGCRFYTFLYTLAYAMEAAADSDVRFVVLDRPNPIAPLAVAGNRVSDAHASFVGNYRLPIVHGMTVGELARYFNAEFDIGADLDVIEISGWSHDTWYDETELLWIPPSPNLPTLEAATIYPGTCFFEGTTLSEGRGTTRPFEYVGAPWIDAQEWSRTLNDLPLDGVRFRPTYFTPTFSKHEGEAVEGVHVCVRDRNAVDPVAVGLTMLVSAFQRCPEADWRTFGDDYPIDRLAGGPSFRNAVEEWRDSDEVATADERFRELRADWADERETFADLRERYRLY